MAKQKNLKHCTNEQLMRGREARDAMQEALIQNDGIVSKAANKLGLSPSLIYRLMQANEDYSNFIHSAQEEAREIKKDNIEALLMDRAVVNTQALLFLAKNELRDRGYTDKQDINIQGDAEIKISWGSE